MSAPNWRPAVDEQPEAPKEQPSFHRFSSEWLAARELEGLAEKTITDLRARATGVRRGPSAR